jgi:hypothetical protein
MITAVAGHSLTAAEVLRVWEIGGVLHPIDRALLLCGFAAPEVDPASLAALSLGERDALLLELRARTFGDRIDAVIDCERCKAGLELSITVDSLRIGAPGADPRVVFEDRELALRKLDSRDLAAIARIADASEARRMLVVRGVIGDPGALSEAELAKVAERLGEIDPQADLVFDLICSECRCRFAAPFDIASFVWGEVSIEARRLMQEVVALARAFGWSEREILAMSRKRRERYLELAEA